MAGSKVPENAAPPGAVQLPPACAPVSEANNATGAAVVHSASDPFVPASGASASVTMTDALVLGQGEAEATV
jgi:hypothetical protein